MVAVEAPPNASLAELLSARARRTPRDRLALDIVGGLCIAAAAVWARPDGWLAVAAAAACFAGYGVWALAELRLLRDTGTAPERGTQLWSALQGAAAVAGLGAFVLLLFAMLGLGLGRLIS